MGGKSSVPKLEAMKTAVPGGADALMGYWFVHGVKPTYFEKGACNSLEHYQWSNQAKQELQVTFKYRSGSCTAREQQFLQDGKVISDTG